MVVLWNANGQIQRTYICIWWGRISDEYINCWTLQAITFFPYKIFLAKISTRNNVFNYDKLWLDCFHGYWSRDFYWPFGEYIYIWTLNLSQACTLPALHKNHINWTQLKTKQFLLVWHPFFSRPGFIYSILI